MKSLRIQSSKLTAILTGNLEVRDIFRREAQDDDAVFPGRIGLTIADLKRNVGQGTKEEDRDQGVEKSGHPRRGYPNNRINQSDSCEPSPARTSVHHAAHP